MKPNTVNKFDGDDIALASGILSSIRKSEFVFILIFMKRFLNLVAPADKILQSRDVCFRESMPVIETTLNNVLKLRTISSFDSMWKQCEDMVNTSGQNHH